MKAAIIANMIVAYFAHPVLFTFLVYELCVALVAVKVHELVFSTCLSTNVSLGALDL